MFHFHLELHLCWWIGILFYALMGTFEMCWRSYVVILIVFPWMLSVFGGFCLDPENWVSTFCVFSSSISQNTYFRNCFWEQKYLLFLHLIHIFSENVFWEFKHIFLIFFQEYIIFQKNPRKQFENRQPNKLLKNYSAKLILKTELDRVVPDFANRVLI